MPRKVENWGRSDGPGSPRQLPGHPREGKQNSSTPPPTRLVELDIRLQWGHRKTLNLRLEEVQREGDPCCVLGVVSVQVKILRIHILAISRPAQ
eukprot:5411335-Amphidinium_carterae.1